ncbi:MAG: BadF/BadG/BcrA/BcrD ATPase family protein, partial [Candidatus Rokuibacteriota bacterium]
MKLVGVDVGSTTVKAAVVDNGKVTWQDYQRHNTKQAEKVVEFLGRMEAEAGLTAGTDRVFFTGSGAGFIAPQVGGKLIQEVVAVAACVEQLHPDVRFVSEIGGEDMKTIFFTASGSGKSKQVFMQSACSGGTGTFIEKTARKLQVPTERLAEMVFEFLARMESECGFAPQRDRVFFTGSGAGFLAPLVGAKVIQEVVAVSAAVEKLHPGIRFVSEIGGEDMKTVFFTPSGDGTSKQVYMQSACSGGTGTFIEKT